MPTILITAAAWLITCLLCYLVGHADGKTETENGMIGILFNDGHNEEYWKEELK